MKPQIVVPIDEERVFGHYAKATDVKGLFDVLTRLVKEVRNALKKEIDTSAGILRASISGLEKKVDALAAKATTHTDSSIKTTERLLIARIAQVESSMPDMPELQGLEDKIEKLNTLYTPEYIRDSLESIEEERDKLAIDAISGLKEELEKLKRRKNVTIFGGGATGGGRFVKTYDLSDSLNGVLKTFALPAFWRIITVQSSSFPVAFRPTVDYTVDANAMTITFTSEIEASTTLATGQTILVIYAET